MGSINSFCLISIMHFNFHIIETTKNITINILQSQHLFKIFHIFKPYNVLQICLALPYFYLLKNVPDIFFQHFKDTNPLFSSGFFHSVSTTKVFFCFQDFRLSLVLDNYSKGTNARCYKMNTWI